MYLISMIYQPQGIDFASTLHHRGTAQPPPPHTATLRAALSARNVSFEYLLSLKRLVSFEIRSFPLVPSRPSLSHPVRPAPFAPSSPTPLRARPA